jgi:hypothetical protein
MSAATGQEMPLGVVRPYRSHRLRACDLCRRRKLRCIVDLQGHSCALCRVKGLTCQYVLGGEARLPARASRAGRHGRTETASRSVASPARTPRHSVQDVEEGRLATDGRFTGRSPAVDHDDQREIRSSVSLDGDDDDDAAESLHIIGPNGSHDTKFIEQHLSPPATMQSNSGLFRIYSDDSRHPAVYTTEPQHHQDGVHRSRGPNLDQRQILEQILGPSTGNLLNLWVLTAILQSAPEADRPRKVSSKSPFGFPDR